MTRLARHETIAAALADAPGDVLAAARPHGTGIGGSTWLLRVEDEPVFVKRVALTDVERRHEGSTADLYGLPPWAHYGVGSAGGGAWRELAAHRAASDWVRTGECENFPLLHHWRVLPGLPRPRTDLARDVAFWHDDPGVRRRLEALDGATADLVLFLEHIPGNLTRWLETHPDGTGLAHRDLRAVTEFLAAQGVQHFDAHFANILTDGERLYLTDFGLAALPDFTLSGAEAEFLAEHADHDRAYVLTHLVNSIVRRLVDAPDYRARHAFVRECAAGRALPELPSADLLRRYAPLAVVVNEFYVALHGESRKTPYPAEEIAQQLDRAGLPANRSAR
ncbi:hypothetical protein [Amycolatopsis sp. SID8362]|uniref:hypothetical protein n=1 Tax=Amycolatopsis sp. SID8362 TaxID=2690346 RepID=UPI00137075A9|nr:hypothetical protein [Amycolatopsis sp. SID8362]NBH11344.1 hypothetical protein [Amycolatopsis sp. SID8362]NED48036.1 hypothetical protein [Amycolatopsis sp. SID8362]